MASGSPPSGDVLSLAFTRATAGSIWQLDRERVTIDAIAVWTDDRYTVAPPYVVLASVDGLEGASHVLWTGDAHMFIVGKLVPRSDTSQWAGAVERAARESRLAETGADDAPGVAATPAGTPMEVADAPLGRLLRQEGTLDLDPRVLARAVTFYAQGTDEMLAAVRAAVDRLPRVARWVLKRTGVIDELVEDSKGFDIAPRHVAFLRSATEPVAVFDHVSLHVGLGPETTAALRPSGWLRAARGA
ncbi:hypothetical protein BH20ACT16_BH20ACT16_00450 [soil metagenome]